MADFQLLLTAKPSSQPGCPFPGWYLQLRTDFMGITMDEKETVEERREKVRREVDALSLEEFARREDLLACVKKDELEKIIKDAVKSALDMYQHKCVLHLEQDQIKQVGNLLNAIREVGDGKLEHGVEVIRDNHKLISKYTAVTGKIGTSVITAVVFIVLGFLGSSVVIGIVEKLKGAIKN